MKPAAACLAALLVTAPLAPALAQVPATPAAPPPVPSHSCVKPEFPGRIASESMIRRWQTDFRAYVDCMKAYIAERKAAIDAQAAKAKAAVDEINANVAEYNETVKSQGD